ncbi:MAG: DUF4190 domain-containing protein [Ruminococcus sp.]|nr:DUF4190 domain-containing protein [Ruminococcus sp.]
MENNNNQNEIQNVNNGQNGWTNANQNMNPNGGYQNGNYNGGYQNNPYNNGNYQGNYQNMNNNNNNQGSGGFGIASMVLGIIALVLWCMIYISIPCAVIGLVLGLAGLFSKKAKGMALTGVITSLIAIMLIIFSYIFADDMSYGMLDYLEHIL